MVIDFLTPILSIIDKVIPDAKQAAEAKQKLVELEQQGEMQELEELGKVVVAEAQGASWLQRSWRPLTMLTFVFIIANNYIIAPYVSAFGGHVPTLSIPPDMWQLMEMGLGGYIALRSVEKAVKTIKGDK